MKKYDTAIIGAGPAGMMAAITTSAMGKHVALIDRNPQPGRKLLATGNGRCNLTNVYAAVDRYHGATPEFIETVLSRFDQNATMIFFQDLGLVMKEEEKGRVFPRTNQASSVVEVLRYRLREDRVDMLLDSQVKAIERSAVWKISFTDGRTLKSDRLILATGGRAAHYFGSTGDGLYWAQKLGHNLTPIYPALVPIETTDTWPKGIHGLKVEAGVQATCDGEKIGQSEGDVLFTSYGVSGPAIMAQARGIGPLLDTHKVHLHIDLFTDMTEGQLYQLIREIISHDERKTVGESLVGILPGNIIPVALRLAGVSEEKRAAELPADKWTHVVRTLKDLVLTVSKLRPLKEAQVTAGGLNTSQINPHNLESRFVDGLFFAGEIIDVDGDSGGFNLQWAWSSGYVAGMGSE